MPSRGSKATSLWLKNNWTAKHVRESTDVQTMRHLTRRKSTVSFFLARQQKYKHFPQYYWSRWYLVFCSSLAGWASILTMVTVQIIRHLDHTGFTDSAEAFKHAQSLMDLYHSCQHLYTGLDEKDRGPADDLPELAVRSLVRAWQLDPSRASKYLLHVSFCMEWWWRFDSKNVAKCSVQDLDVFVFLTVHSQRLAPVMSVSKLLIKWCSSMCLKQDCINNSLTHHEIHQLFNQP